MTGVFDIRASAFDARSGGKAAGLRWLFDHGYRIPPTWVLLPSVSETQDLTDVLRHDIRYAVRSSANVEDGGATSYAGQFVSVLDVQGPSAMDEAIGAVRRSASTDGVAAYREHQGDDRVVQMSVIVQEMVDPIVSGVAFSRNPITGLSETVVEVVEGTGDRLQTEGVTPQTWVHRWGDFTQRPEEASVGVHIVEEVVEAVGRMAAEYGAPVDAEWVYDGSHVWWVQIRKITGIDDVTVYSRRIAREVLPGMIKPLVWSINVPMVNRAWLDLLEEAVGELGLEAEDLARPFGYRAYFNMTAFGEVFAALGMPRESLELLLGLPAGSEQPRFAPSFATVAKTPRVLRLGMQHRSYAEVVDAGVTRLTAAYRVFDGRDLSELDDAGLLTDIEQMRTIGVEAARMNVVTPLFANAYAALLRRQLRGTSVDATAAMAAAAGPAYDPNPHLDTLAVMMESLGEDERAAIAEGGYDALPSDLKRAFDAFFDEFGHFSDSGNDFSVPPWSETPDVVVEVAAKRAVVDRPTGSTVRGTVPAWRYPLVRLLFRKTTAYGTRRDAVSSMYTYGYGLFRRYFLEVGRRLSDRNILDTPDDVMYLDFAEVVDALNSGGPRQNEVARRRAEMSDLVDVEMPDLIYGDDFVPVQPNPNATVWNGTPTARGSHAGPARIVRGLDDFSKVIDGDVIVIPFSDVGWTPLFAKAGAVVAESGGMLSHSSIVAREYGIPCVVSVNGALRIPDGATVMVDGYGGTVTLDTET